MYLFWPSFEEKLDSESERYKSELVEIESAIETAKDEVDGLKKGIMDLEKLIEQYSNGPYPIPEMEALYVQLPCTCSMFRHFVLSLP